MNEIVNTILLAEYKFMPEMDLRQLGFTYSAYGSLTNNKEIIQKIKETVDSSHIYQKPCFQHGLWLMEILMI